MDCSDQTECYFYVDVFTSSYFVDIMMDIMDVIYGYYDRYFMDIMYVFLQIFCMFIYGYFGCLLMVILDVYQWLLWMFIYGYFGFLFMVIQDVYEWLFCMFIYGYLGCLSMVILYVSLLDIVWILYMNTMDIIMLQYSYMECYYRYNIVIWNVCTLYFVLRYIYCIFYFIY